MKYPIFKREEELKNEVAHDYFDKWKATPMQVLNIYKTSWITKELNLKTPLFM